MDESLWSGSFLFAEKPHKKRQSRFPLDSLSLDRVTGKYYYDLEGGAFDEVAVEEGFLTFFREVEKAVEDENGKKASVGDMKEPITKQEAFKEILGAGQWSKIEKINKGWSADIKYYVETADQKKLLLRVSSIDKYEEKKQEYEIINKFAGLGFPMSFPVAFGTFDENRSVYLLLEWVEGEDLETALPKMSEEQQYVIGREAGHILKQIHSIKVLEEEQPKETKEDKKRLQLQKYKQSAIRVPGDEKVIVYTEQNIGKIWSEPPVYQHGDFHPGNLILTPEGGIGVIDFNRWEIGDPYEEFYKLESFGVEVSIPYCRGQIDAYFHDHIPEKFWEVLAVYVAHASLYSIKWAEKFGQKDIDEMVKRYYSAYSHYNGFLSLIPDWYRSGK